MVGLPRRLEFVYNLFKKKEREDDKFLDLTDQSQKIIKINTKILAIYINQEQRCNLIVEQKNKIYGRKRWGLIIKSVYKLNCMISNQLFLTRPFNRSCHQISFI